MLRCRASVCCWRWLSWLRARRGGRCRRLWPARLPKRSRHDSPSCTSLHCPSNSKWAAGDARFAADVPAGSAPCRRFAWVSIMPAGGAGRGRCPKARRWYNCRSPRLRAHCRRARDSGGRCPCRCWGLSWCDRARCRAFASGCRCLRTRWRRVRCPTAGASARTARRNPCPPLLRAGCAARPRC